MPVTLWRRRSSTATYAPLKSTSDAKISKNSRSIAVNFVSISWSLLILVVVSILSFIAGKHYSTLGTHPSPASVLDLHSYKHKFNYNDIYASKPNITTDKAWLDLFPFRGGFFTHPSLAPERSTFAVFHQLHCLDGIRHAYYTLLGSTLEGKKMRENELPHHARVEHVKHCIELLRNVLTCQPDLTLEVVREQGDGVTGFETEHACVVWKELVSWVGEWEMYQGEQASKMGEQDWYEDERVHGQEHKHGGGHN